MYNLLAKFFELLIISNENFAEFTKTLKIYSSFSLNFGQKFRKVKKCARVGGSEAEPRS